MHLTRICQIEKQPVYHFGDILGSPYVDSYRGGGELICHFNCVGADITDNGFIRGPSAVKVIDVDAEASFTAVFSRGNNRRWIGITWRGIWDTSEGWNVEEEIRSFE